MACMLSITEVPKLSNMKGQKSNLIDGHETKVKVALCPNIILKYIKYKKYNCKYLILFILYFVESN